MLLSSESKKKLRVREKKIRRSPTNPNAFRQCDVVVVEKKNLFFCSYVFLRRSITTCQINRRRKKANLFPSKC